MMKKIYPILISILFSISLVQVPFNAASLFVVTNVTWGTSTSPVEAGPGDRNVALTISLLYQGSYNIKKLQADLFLPSGFTNTEGGTIATVYTTSVSVNTIFSLTFNLNIDANAALTTYTMSLRFLFDTIVSKDSTETISVNVPLKGKSKLTFEATNTYLYPGQVNEFTVTLSNTGNGNVTDVTTSISASSQVSLLTKLPSISSLNSLSSTTFNVSLYVSPTAANSPLSITFSATYKDAYLNSRSTSETLGFIVKPIEQSLFEVSASPKTLIIGETNQVEITLENTGTIDLKNATLTISAQSPTALIDSDGKINLGTINSGESASFNIDIYVSSTTTTTASMAFSVSYIDQSGAQKVESRTINFFITSLGEKFLILDTTWGTFTNPSEVGPGDLNSQLTISLQYFGNTTVQSLHGNLILPNAFTNVNGDQQASAQAVSISPNSIFQLPFALNIADNASLDSYTIPLMLSWNTTFSKGNTQIEYVKVHLKGKVKLSISAEGVLNPGQENILTIRLNNEGTGAASQISISVTAPSSVSILNQIPTISVLAANSTYEVPLKLYISASSAGAPITFTFSITYKDAYLNSRNANQNLGFVVKTMDQTFFSICATPRILTVGETNQVKVTLENTGTVDMKNIFMTITPQLPIVLMGSDGKLNIGRMNIGESTDFTLDLYVSSTTASTASVSLSISYIDPSEASKSETRTLTFLLNPRPLISPISLNVQPTTLIAGKANNLTITVQNIADYPISSISMSFAFSGGQVTWLQPDIAQAEELAPGQSIIIHAKAYDPPLTTASVTLQISIKYYDNSSVLCQEARNIGLLSKGIIDLTLVDLSIIPEQITPGQIFSITGTITNIGTITASAVTATPHLPEGFIMFGSRSIFIGDMAVNTPTTFTLSIQVTNATKPNRYQIPVELSYNDNLRNPLSTTIIVPVGVSERAITTTISRTTTSTWNLTSILPLIATAAIALIVGYMLGKRVKRQ